MIDYIINKAAILHMFTQRASPLNKYKAFFFN